MKAKYRADEVVKAWQKAPIWQQNLWRAARLALCTPLYLAQLFLIPLDIATGSTYYGRKSWDFKFRALRLLGGYLAWFSNPGTVPFNDVLSIEARRKIGKLKEDQHAVLVEVPPCEEKMFGDAVYEGLVPQPCPCFWQWLPSSMPDPTSDPAAMEGRKVMMYFVGGGMVQGHPVVSPLPWRIMEATQIPVFGVNFRKCVTKTTAFPAAIQDAVAAFDYLLKQGFLPGNISIMGDSGGGGIAFTTLLYLLRHNLPLPGSAVLICPFVSLVDTFTDDPELLNLDGLNPEMCSSVSYQYTENRPELRGTLLSPSENKLPSGYTFSGFPRTMMVHGDAEIFAPSIIKTTSNLRAAGVQVESIVGIDHVHCYPYYTTDKSANSFFGRVKSFLDGDGRYD